MRKSLFILALAIGFVGCSGGSATGTTTPPPPPPPPPLKITPTITWAAPASITAGTPLSSTQLDATASANGASVAGTFAYNPPEGTVLAVGANQTLDVTFTPTDTATYNNASGSTTITVTAAQSVPMVAYMDFEYNDPNAVNSQYQNIYVFPLSDPTKRTRVTANSVVQNWSPAISPDRMLIAYTATIDPSVTCSGCNYYAVYYVKSDGTGTQTLVTNGYTGIITGASYDPDWSADGTKLSFAYIDWTQPAGGATAGIGIWDKTTNTTTLLPATEEAHAGRSFSIPGHTRFLPDGRVLYTSARSGNWQNYIASADGLTITNLNNTSSNDEDATPSPDGTKIAFDSNRSGVEAIYTMTITGGNVTQVSFPSTGDPANVFHSQPAWTPDGTEIIFTLGNGTGLDTVKSDGSNGEVPLLPNGAARFPYCR
jgi:hypothetical protein